MRQRLAKIGYSSDIANLPAWKADLFCLISGYIDQLQAEELKKARNSQGSR
jgi:hypothetical protein